MNFKPVKIKVFMQGKVVVNSGIVYKQGKNVVALEIDLKSKYCEVCMITGGSEGQVGLVIGPTPRSLYLNRRYKREETWVEFPEFKGWNIWAADIARYTLRVCLIKY